MSDATFRHVLALLLLLARAADIGSTRLATPRLALEANPVMRRLGWRFALLTLLAALLPYYNTSLAVVALVPSFMVAGGNFVRGWSMRALGEAECRAIAHRAARRASRRTALAFLWAGAACVAAPGALLLALSDPRAWGYWFACGWLLYAAAIALHGSAAVVRTFREAATVPDPAADAALA